MKFCGQCGAELVDSACFCANCGAEVKTTDIMSETAEPVVETAEPVVETNEPIIMPSLGGMNQTINNISERDMNVTISNHSVKKRKNGLVLAVIVLAICLFLVIGFFVLAVCLRWFSKTKSVNDEIGQETNQNIEQDTYNAQNENKDFIEYSEQDKYAIQKGIYQEDTDDEFYLNYFEIVAFSGDTIQINIYTEHKMVHTIGTATVNGKLVASTRQDTQYMIETAFVDSWNNEGYFNAYFDCEGNTVYVESDITIEDADARIWTGRSGTYLWKPNGVETDDAYNSYYDEPIVLDDPDKLYVANMDIGYDKVKGEALFTVTDMYYGYTDGYYYLTLNNMEDGLDYVLYGDQAWNTTIGEYLAGTFYFYSGTSRVVKLDNAYRYDSYDYASAYDYYNSLIYVEPAGPSLSSNFKKDYDTAIYDEKTGLWVIANTQVNGSPFVLDHIEFSDYKDGCITMLPAFMNNASANIRAVGFDIQYIDEEGNSLLKITVEGLAYNFDENTMIFATDEYFQGSYTVKGKRYDGTWGIPSNYESEEHVAHVKSPIPPGAMVYLPIDDGVISLPVYATDIKKPIYGLYITMNVYGYE